MADASVQGAHVSAAAPATGSGSGLVERERETAALSEALADARAGRGALVILQGPAGIGKSRLLTAACERAAREQQMDVLRARGIELDRDVPFGVMSELFGPRLASATAAQRDEFLAGHARFAASLFDPGAAALVDPQALIRGLYWLTVNVASDGRRRGRPLAIAVDDAQWSDRSSLRFLAHLAARIDDSPVALILAIRTADPTPCDDLLQSLRQFRGRVVLDLPPLSEAAVGALIEAELPGAEQAFITACTNVSGGNPFMVRELVRTLGEEGLMPTAETAHRVQRLVPATVLHSILTRLGRLGDTARAIATAACVLGDGAPLRHAIALSGIEAREAEDAADALAGAGILAAEEPLRFAHPLIASAIYSDLPLFARARAHRTAADLLAADGASLQEIAAHLRLTTPGCDPWTVSTLREAARRDVAQGDPDAAARLLARALAEPPQADQRAEVLLELAEADGLRGSLDAEGHATRALEQVADPAARMPALRVLSRIRLAAGDHQAAAEALEEILDRTGLDDVVAQQILGEYLTVSRFTAPFLPEVRRRLAPIVDTAREGAPPRDPVLLAHVALELAMSGERPHVVRALAELATASHPLVDLGSYGMPMGIVVQALCCVDELTVAEQIAEAAATAASRQGSFFAAALANYHRAIPRYHRGALADALADLDQALAPSREGWSAGAAWSQALQVHSHLERGEMQAAAQVLGQVSTRPESMDVPIALFARARFALANRDPAAAYADAHTAGRLLHDQFGIDHPGFMPWRLTAAVAATGLGDHRRARELADEQLELARAVGVPRALAIALRTAAAVAGDRNRVGLLSDATDALANSPSALERAHVSVSLGGALRRMGRRSDAQAPLREALQLADRMGAVPLANLARDELRATGARPRRAAFNGADALTPAELRVAKFAAEGLTNAQIAQDLFVTTKTVQTHLAHAYRKLNIASRRELAVALNGEKALGTPTSSG